MKKQVVRELLALAVSVSVLLLLIFSLAYGQTPGSPEPGRACDQDGRPARGIDFKGHGYPPVGPPPEAYSACKDKEAGSAAQLVTPWGETLKGTCRQMDGKLVMIPELPEGMKMATRPAPPPPCCCGCAFLPPGCGGQYPPPPPDWEEIDLFLDPR